jgi:hypothetical protein
VEIGDNLVENAIRPTCIGKKSWMFFGSEEAGVRNAAVFTLIQNCGMHGIEPYAYLKDLLERLPTTTNKQAAELTPRKWKLARASGQARPQNTSAHHLQRSGKNVVNPQLFSRRELRLVIR